MSLVRRLVKAVAHTPFSNDSPNLDRLFARTQSYSGRTVTQGTSMQNATVYACVRLLSETVASLPLQRFERTEAGRRELEPLPWMRQPNPEMTRFRLIERTVASLLLDGNAFWEYERDNLGRLTNVVPLHPQAVRMQRNPDTGEIDYQIAGRKEPADPRRMLHIPFFEGAGGLRGMSPITACAAAIGFAQDIDEYGAKLFGSGAYLSGVLETDQALGEPQVRRLQAEWANDHAGLDNVHKPGVLTGGLKWKPLTLPNDQAQFLETRRFQVEEICRIFRVPPHLVQSLERATFSNIENQGIDFVTHSVRPILVRIEDALLTVQDDPFEYLRFNVGGLMRGDMLSRFQAHAIAVNTGWESPNDVRAVEDQNPVEGLDEYRRPLNMAVVGSLPPANLMEQVNAAGVLVRSGYAPDAALTAVGLDPIQHLGLLLVTVQSPEA